MRRLFMIGLATLFFSGCMGDVAAPVEQVPPERQVEAAALQADVLSKVPAFYGDYQPNPHVTDDRRLGKPGEVIRDSNGEAEVLKATGEQKQVSAGPAELTIRESKMLRYEPDPGLADRYRKFTHETEFPIVKLFVEIRNTGDEPIHFDPVAMIVTDQDETLHWDEEIYLEGLGGEIDPGEVKTGNIGFILDDANAQVLTLHTGSADGNHREDGDKVEIKF
ncbi:DUF4352 domain-containing protein [Bhargavaea cecembensis]|nr:DUF4352 domain-containing protein [Bhargavaea cecembensis]